MTGLIQWNPFKEMDDLCRLFSSQDLQPSRSGWVPAVDIAEDTKEYLIKAELPELNREDIKLTVEDGVLTLSGERKSETEEKDKRYHRVERASGSFQRSFGLPEDTDAGQIKAEFKNGVLCVHVPKTEKAKPKQISVDVG